MAKDKEPKKVKYPWHDIAHCTIPYCTICDDFFKSLPSNKGK